LMVVGNCSRIGEDRKRLSQFGNPYFCLSQQIHVYRTAWLQQVRAKEKLVLASVYEASYITIEAKVGC